MAIRRGPGRREGGPGRREGGPGRREGGHVLGKLQVFDIDGTEILVRRGIGHEVVTVQVRRPIQVELLQGLLTCASDVHTQLLAGTNTNTLPADLAKRSVDGAEEVHDCV